MNDMNVPKFSPRIIHLASTTALMAVAFTAAVLMTKSAHTDLELERLRGTESTRLIQLKSAYADGLSHGMVIGNRGGTVKDAQVFLDAYMHSDTNRIFEAFQELVANTSR